MSKKTQNPWFSIWRYPEKTISRLASAKNYKQVNLITALIGLSLTLSSITFLGDFGLVNRSKYLAIFLACTIGALGSVLYVKLGGYFLSRLGLLFHGSAKPNQVELAIAWSSVPIIFAIPFWLPVTFLELFNDDILNPVFLITITSIAIIFNGIGRVLHIFSFAYLGRMLAVVHHISKWKSFIVTSLGALIIGVPLLLVYLFFG